MDGLVENRESREWTFSEKKLMASTRLKYETDFTSGKRKKSVLWKMILGHVKSINKDFPFSSDDIHKKFCNLFTTYKRIKKRNAETGQEATKWEFFIMFDEVYGCKHFVSPPSNLIASSSSFEKDCSDFECDEDIFNDSTESTYSSRGSKRQKKKENENEVLEFLKNEAIEEEQRHKEQINIEIERIKVLQGVKDLLEKMLQ